MLNFVSGKMYRDVAVNDFYTYFQDTAMAYKLTDTKRRVFIIAGPSGETHNHLSGSYLTTKGEWRDKTISLREWTDYLEPILPGIVSFDLSEGACLWKPQLSRSGKKSFPWKTNQIQFFGKISGTEKTTQGAARALFGSVLYGDADLRCNSIAEALAHASSARITRDGFLVDKHRGTLYFRGSSIGSIADNRIYLNPRMKFFKRKIEESGVPVVLTDGVRRGMGSLEELRRAYADYGCVDWAPTQQELEDQGQWADYYGPADAWNTWETYYILVHENHVHRRENDRVRVYNGWYPGGPRLKEGWRLYQTRGHD